jgi:hypothetical protein
MTNHFALVLHPRFGYARFHKIRADGYEEVGEVVLFRRDERVVYQVRADLVSRIEAFESDLQAREYIREQRQRRLGAATMYVQEYGSVPRAGKKRGAKKKLGGFLAEGVQIRVSEKPRKK